MLLGAGERSERIILREQDMLHLDAPRVHWSESSTAMLCAHPTGGSTRRFAVAHGANHNLRALRLEALRLTDRVEDRGAGVCGVWPEAGMLPTHGGSLGACSDATRPCHVGATLGCPDLRATDLSIEHPSFPTKRTRLHPRGPAEQRAYHTYGTIKQLPGMLRWFSLLLVHHDHRCQPHPP